MAFIPLLKSPRIRVVGAGGTIGSDDAAEDLSAVGEGKLFLENMLKDSSSSLQDFDISVKHTYSLLSEDMNPKDWSELTHAIVKETQNGDDVDGIVVTHGTDTLAYTASAVSFMIEPPKIPIVFTAAFYPPDHPESDARENLLNSIRMAANADVGGVFIVFGSKRGGSIFQANRTMSMMDYGRYYTSIDGRPLGGFVANGIELRRGWQALAKRDRSNRALGATTHVEPCVKIIRLYPGFDPADLERISLSSKAVILDLYHSGTACTRDARGEKYSLVRAITSCVENGVQIYGLPMEKVQERSKIYESTRQLLNAGVIPLPPMTLESAYSKLVWLYGSQASQTEIEKSMKRNLRGEIVSLEMLNY